MPGWWPRHSRVWRERAGDPRRAHPAVSRAWCSQRICSPGAMCRASGARARRCCGMAIPPTMLTLYTTATLGGYTETLAVRQHSAVDGRWPLVVGQLAGGQGAGCYSASLLDSQSYTFPLILIYLIPNRIALDSDRLRWRAWRGYLMALLGFALGSAPWWLMLIQSGGMLLAEMTVFRPCGNGRIIWLAGRAGCSPDQLFPVWRVGLGGSRYPWSAELVLPLLGLGALLFYLSVFGLRSGAGRASVGHDRYLVRDVSC